ncbi:esterase [Novosphingobium sp. PC22D]|uniref:alpha/beta hydrolase fold domain-containing protein n=1 Tax=Novosphingobium sp. PC22D TaxID=1962403 RepID=UPI000BF1B567|nr:alpha/beta hydrolase [Novosphingobium sp. PC22D]PEQ14255.1 esterase [Novosphingobium sp. PC22D]
MNVTSAKTPTFRPDGTVAVPAFDLPVSPLVSEEAAAAQRALAEAPPFSVSLAEGDVTAHREAINAYVAPQVEHLRKAFAVEVSHAEIAGVEVIDVTPAGGGHDPDRVLVNLHGGAFVIGWDGSALLESVPISALGSYRVISVNYRMAPEHRHPAAIEDVVAVYRALLDDYAPGRIGIYGGSAGGVLSAQVAGWLPRHGLPQAGAVGIFGAGGAPFHAGESAYIAGYVDGSFAPPPPDGSPIEDITRGYFDGVDPRDPVAWPAYHLDVLEAFPPTLVITGTRAVDLSPAIYTNSQLLKAGVRSTLIVGEGMGHCHHYRLDLPEGRDAVEQILSFFRENLT